MAPVSCARSRCRRSSGRGGAGQQHARVQQQGEAFDAAHALYARFGFTPTGPFAAYADDPFSRFLTLEL